MIQKIIIALFLMATGAGVGATVVRAASVPEFNPQCWKREQCVEARLNFMREDMETASAEKKKEAAKGWIEGDGDCTGDDWGRCLPAGTTATAIAFGGRREFENLGVFIQLMYKYALSIVGIIAAVVVVVSGAQWAASGGNSEVISSAKTRILGALVGSLIAYLSYTILNLVNPSLVNFRLPQVWMVRPQGLVPQFCSNAPAEIRNGKNFAQAADWKDQVTPVDTTKVPDFNLSMEDQSHANLERFYCGKRFLIKDGGNQTCFGDYCGEKQVCVEFNNTGDEKKKYVCRSGLLAGKVSGTFGLFRVPALDQDDNIKLFAVCKDKGLVKQVGPSINYPGYSGKGDPFIFPYVESFASVCNSAGGVIGFFLALEVNDETGFTGGGWKEGLPFSTGSDDWFAVGQSAPGSRVCNVNLAKYLYLANANELPKCGPTTAECTCAMFKNDKAVLFASDQPRFADHLISVEELKKGYVCNVSLNRTEFPAFDVKAFKDPINPAKVNYFLPILAFDIFYDSIKALADPTSCP